MRGFSSIGRDFRWASRLREECVNWRTLKQVRILFDDEDFFLSEVAFEVFFQLSEEASRDFGFAGDHAVDDDVVVICDSAERPKDLIRLRKESQPAEFRQQAFAKSHQLAAIHRATVVVGQWDVKVILFRRPTLLALKVGRLRARLR